LIKKLLEDDDYIDREELKKAVLEAGISESNSQFRTILSEIKKKGLIEVNNNKISMVEEF